MNATWRCHPCFLFVLTGLGSGMQMSNDPRHCAAGLLLAGLTGELALAAAGGGMSALLALVALMAAHTNADADGRVVVDAAARTVKFVLLNAAAHFGKARYPAGAFAPPGGRTVREGEARLGGRACARALVETRWCRGARCGACPPAAACGVTSPVLAHPGRAAPRSASAHARAARQVVAAAHAVVLASGTLAPVAALRRALFPGAPARAVRAFACGHVVPRERLLALALGRGPGGRELDLRAERRGAPGALDELGRLLLNVCQAVPQARAPAGQGAGPGRASPGRSAFTACSVMAMRVAELGRPAAECVPGCAANADFEAGVLAPGVSQGQSAYHVLPEGRAWLPGQRHILAATQSVPGNWHCSFSARVAEHAALPLGPPPSMLCRHGRACCAPAVACPGCARTPQGVVAFFPSFAYADQAAQRWEATGALAALAARKRVFREPRAAAAVEQTLAQFAVAAAGQAIDGRAGRCRLEAALHVKCLSMRHSMTSPPGHVLPGRPVHSARTSPLAHAA